MSYTILQHLNLTNGSREQSYGLHLSETIIQNTHINYALQNYDIARWINPGKHRDCAQHDRESVRYIRWMYIHKRSNAVHPFLSSLSKTGFPRSQTHWQLGCQPKNHYACVAVFQRDAIYAFGLKWGPISHGCSSKRMIILSDDSWLIQAWG